MIDLRGIETFFWAAQLGGFGLAARRLSTTQPAVSQRIAALESALGVQLFVRGARHASLSAKGRELLPIAEQMLRLRSELLTTSGSTAAFRGRVRLGVAETVVHTRLVEIARRVHATYPQITLDIEVDTSQNLHDRLLEGSLDIVILLGAVIEPNARSLDFARYPLAWVASPALDLPRRRLTLADIARFPVITYARGSRPPLDVSDLFQRAGLREHQIFSNSSLSSIVKLCVEGMGVGMLPAAVAERELGSGELRLLRAADASVPDLAFTLNYLKTADIHLLEAIATLALDEGRTSRTACARRTAPSG